MIGILIQFIITWFLAWLLEKKDLGVLGLRPTRHRLSYFAMLFLLTAILCSLGFLLKSFFGDQTWRLNPELSLSLVAKGLWWNLKSVLFEELIFRGVLLYILIKKMGVKYAVIISAAAFGMYHWFSFGVLGNPVQMIFVFVITGIMGLLLAYAYAKTYSLYYPLAIHLGWNVTQIFIFSQGPIGNGIFIQQKPVPFRTDSLATFFLVTFIPIILALTINFQLMRRIKLLPVFIFLIALSCNQQQAATSTDTRQQYFTYNDSIEAGGVKLIPIKTPAGDFKVWTKRFGNNPKIKVLLLHGGPAMTHEYMECFETFFQREGFEFYEYDQLGSYYSDQPKDSSLWTIPRFVEEVEQVRQAIGADSSNFFVLGNSWGGILAMEYALKYQQHLKGMIVANMVASAPEYGKYSVDVLSKQMNPAVLAEIREIEAKKDYGNPRYMELLIPNFYHEHLCRLKEWPDAFNRTLKHVNGEIYTMMQGPSEFGISGRLANWDITNRLREIAVPTLMVGAKFDTMDPNAMEAQSKMVQHGSYLFCPNGSHLAMWDDQQVFMKGVIGFINTTEAK